MDRLINKFSLNILLLCLSVVCSNLGLADEAGSFEVIVNSTVSETALSKDDVAHILMTSTTSWKDGKKVSLVVVKGDDAVPTTFMNMTGLQAKKFWLTKVFNNTLAAEPPYVDSPKDAVDKVASIEGAMAVVPKGTAQGNTKVKVVALSN